MAQGRARCATNTRPSHSRPTVCHLAEPERMLVPSSLDKYTTQTSLRTSVIPHSIIRHHLAIQLDDPGPPSPTQSQTPRSESNPNPKRSQIQETHTHTQSCSAIAYFISVTKTLSIQSRSDIGTLVFYKAVYTRARMGAPSCIRRNTDDGMDASGEDTIGMESKDAGTKDAG